MLAEWGVEIFRDLRSGEIAHVPTTFLLDRSGRARYRASGDADTRVRLVQTLE